ncbi:MAG TPA: phasin family protein [Nevskia sp.]|jgi:hypothetical protein|nr:phasin family protein [Nevskia sp.]
MSNTLFDKAVLEKLFAFGESAFDNLSEAGGLHTEAAKKLGAAQADLAEATLALGGKPLELFGKASDPAELIRAGNEAATGWREKLDAYFTSLRGVGEELYSGYSGMVRRTLEKSASA